MSANGFDHAAEREERLDLWTQHTDAHKEAGVWSMFLIIMRRRQSYGIIKNKYGSQTMSKKYDETYGWERCKR